jgi:hypothetical protein
MRWLILVSVGLLLVVGCKGKPPTTGDLTGTVTYNGQPVNDAALMLYAGNAEESSFVIPVSEQGTFTTTSVPPGEYKVVVAGRAGGTVGGTAGAQAAANKPTIAFPKKYKDKRTTDLTVNVVAGAQKRDFELKD